MALLQNAFDRVTLDEAMLRRWAIIPTTVASDVMNRGGALPAEIRPLNHGPKLLGRARTLRIMVADSLGLHRILPFLEPNDVLVIDGSGYLENACFGALAAQVAVARGAVGVVVYGAVRDAAELRTLPLEVYASGITPRGPHKGFGGEMDYPVAIGSVCINSGDLVLGDKDGVVVVPQNDATRLITLCEEGVEREEAWRRRILEHFPISVDHSLRP